MIDSRRIEELGLNSSAPPAQLLYDGWLVRLSPGKAKRARSVNAVYPSTLPLDRKIAYCEGLYLDANLPMIFRITPFSQPPDLERALDARGYTRMETTAVESAPLDDAPADGGAKPMALGPWIDPEEFSSGYVARGQHLLPKRGEKPEWAHAHDYWAEKDAIPAIDLTDSAFVYR